MASKEELKKLAVRLVEDDGFRAAYDKNPVEAAKSMGISLTREQEKAIEEQKKLAGAAGARVSKSAFGLLI